MNPEWTIEEEAARLHARFDKLKAEMAIGQAEFARTYNVPGGASMVSQHIKGRRPISLEAATAYARGFQCSLSQISPRLANEVFRASVPATAMDLHDLRELRSEYVKLRKDLMEELGVSDSRLADPLNPQADRRLVKIQTRIAEIGRHIEAISEAAHQAGMDAVSRVEAPKLDQTDDLLIPQYEAGGAMGNGLILEEKQPGIIKSWSVDHDWLRLNVRHHTGVNNLCIVTGFGPSMQPKYNPGDPLLLDRGVTVVETEGIYFFRVGKHGYIKQLQRIPTEDGLIIRAKSLNKDYDPFDITAKMDFAVFGKVLTVWRSEQV